MAGFADILKDLEKNNERKLRVKLPDWAEHFAEPLRTGRVPGETLDFYILCPLAEREKEKEGLLPSSVQIGTMIEVPSLLFQLDELTNEVDFVSIGTNDLAQFFFATDRSNPIIWDKYDSLSPAFLKALQKRFFCSFLIFATLKCTNLFLFFENNK